MDLESETRDHNQLQTSRMEWVDLFFCILSILPGHVDFRNDVCAFSRRVRSAIGGNPLTASHADFGQHYNWPSQNHYNNPSRKKQLICQIQIVKKTRRRNQGKLLALRMKKFYYCLGFKTA